MQHILTLSGVAVVVRHWFEIDLEDASMEHGARIELRELAAHPRRGSESAAQVITLDRPLWRADLFDRLADAPGTFGVAHYHPEFSGHEPCPRVWDPALTASPWRWLRDQFASLGGLEKDGNNLYKNVSNQQPTTPTDVKVRQGMLEGSNVNSIVEITRMIEVSRAYEQTTQMMQSEFELSRNSVSRLGRVN